MAAAQSIPARIRSWLAGFGRLPAELIFHLVEEADLVACAHDGVYAPASLLADGFVHCSLEPSVVPVANDYYQTTRSPLLLLLIDPGSLEAETRYETAAPLAGAGSSHLASAPVFPHVYGPIDLPAILGVGAMRHTADGYAWPDELQAIEDVLDRPIGAEARVGAEAGPDGEPTMNGR
jgi:uncharacterized protein (DUF952 family)